MLLTLSGLVWRQVVSKGGHGIKLQESLVMKIKVKGEMTMAEIRQALFEKLHEIESDFAIRHSIGATLYINPSNGFGDKVVPRKGGRKVDNLYSDGPYRSAADDYKI